MFKSKICKKISFYFRSIRIIVLRSSYLKVYERKLLTNPYSISLQKYRFHRWMKKQYKLKSCFQVVKIRISQFGQKSPNHPTNGHIKSTQAQYLLIRIGFGFSTSSKPDLTISQWSSYKVGSMIFIIFDTIIL